jgi:hypothetical protein
MEHVDRLIVSTCGPLVKGSRNYVWWLMDKADFWSAKFFMLVCFPIVFSFVMIGMFLVPLLVWCKCRGYVMTLEGHIVKNSELQRYWIGIDTEAYANESINWKKEGF